MFERGGRETLSTAADEVLDVVEPKHHRPELEGGQPARFHQLGQRASVRGGHHPSVSYDFGRAAW